MTEPPRAPPWWAPLAWGVALPTAVCMAGFLIAQASRPAAGYFLLLWPVATVAGMAVGCTAQLQRLARTTWATGMIFLAAAAFGVACLAVQAALAVWLGRALKGTP